MFPSGDLPQAFIATTSTPLHFLSPKQWYMDTSATHHLTSDLRVLMTFNDDISYNGHT